MIRFENKGPRRLVRTAMVFCLLLPGILASASGAAEQMIGLPQEHALERPPSGIQAFHPGETLTYDVSWSNIFSAGTVTMAVERATLADEDDREVLRLVVQGRTHGLMDRLFSVNDTVQSVFDPRIMQSRSYSLRESYGKKKRLRVTEIDHVKRTAVCRLNDEPPETLSVPEPVQDGLSMLYYLRAREDRTIGRKRDIDVVDSGKLWTLEVTLLAREKVATAAGEFATVKFRLYPKGREASTKKREVFVWLTDDDRKVPVLMKTELKVGSFVFELTGMRPGSHRFTQ